MVWHPKSVKGLLIKRSGSCHVGAGSGRPDRYTLGPLGPTLPDQKHSDTLEQICWRIHALREKYISPSVAIIYTDFPGKQNGGGLGRQVFDGIDQSRTIKSGHDQVCHHQVHATFPEAMQRICSIGKGQDPVSSGLQHDFADGQCLLIVVDT